MIRYHLKHQELFLIYQNNQYTFKTGDSTMKLFKEALRNKHLNISCQNLKASRAFVSSYFHSNSCAHLKHVPVTNLLGLQKAGLETQVCQPPRWLNHIGWHDLNFYVNALMLFFAVLHLFCDKGNCSFFDN